MQEIQKLPSYLRPLSSDDLLSYNGYPVLGVTSAQAFLKVIFLLERRLLFKRRKLVGLPERARRAPRCNLTGKSVLFRCRTCARRFILRTTGSPLSTSIADRVLANGSRLATSTSMNCTSCARRKRLASLLRQTFNNKAKCARTRGINQADQLAALRSRILVLMSTYFSI